MTREKFRRLWRRLGKDWREAGVQGIWTTMQDVFSIVWVAFWMRYSGVGSFGRLATRLAVWFAPPYKARGYLAGLNPRGYIAPSATIYHTNFRTGANIFIGDRVIIYQADADGGPVELCDRVHIHAECIIEVGIGGSLTIGPDTHIQPRCQFSAYIAAIHIGRHVQIAPYCVFYSYDHSFAAGELISRQPLQTKGSIVIGDDAWLGVGVVVSSGVKIGKGAVIGAGSVVTQDIPDGAVAVGTPARVKKFRVER